jgi:hypothetical protein
MVSGQAGVHYVLSKANSYLYAGPLPRSGKISRAQTILISALLKSPAPLCHTKSFSSDRQSVSVSWTLGSSPSENLHAFLLQH